MDDWFAVTTDYISYENDTGSGYTDDYGSGPTLSTGLCERSWVNAFRGRFEPPLFWTIFALGALGNLTVVCIYTTVRNRLKTMTDVYLLNLAVADLLFLATLPFWASEALQGWDFGGHVCRLVRAFYKVNFFSGMLLLACISVDRYVAIVRSTKTHNLRKTARLLYSKVACLLVWLASLLLALPEFIFAEVKAGGARGRPFCALVYRGDARNHTKILVFYLQICAGFLLPVLIMAVCYSLIVRTLLQARSFEKHKALRVIFAVVAVFVLSQLPYNGLLVMEAQQAANLTITDCEVLRRLDVAGQLAKSLAYTHSCVNPFLYVFIGVRFRRDLVTMLKRVCSGGLGKGSVSKSLSVPKRPSVMSDTETTPALSL